MKDLTSSTSRKVMLAVMLVIVAISAALIALLHVNERTTMRTEELQHITSISNTLAPQLDGNRIEWLKEKYADPGLIIKNTQDARYYLQHEALRQAAEANDLEMPVRILSYDSASGEMQVIVTSADKPTFRTSYGKRSNVILHNYKAGGGIDLIDVEVPRLIALSPLKNSAGNTVAVVAVERPIADIMARTRAHLIRNCVMAALLILAIWLLLFGSVRRWLKRDERAHHALAEKHEGVTDSIAYAGKIQRALIPKADVFNANFSDHFVIDRPKDIVSGDFHWHRQLDEDRCLVATADCTGHGLPGAMMAAIGCSLLNQIVDERPWDDPATLLGRLNERIVRHLDQEGQKKGAGDGMDIALCQVDRKANVILFAGAFRPLYLVHQGQLTVINGDRRPIGGSHHAPDREFTCHRISYGTGDRIYLFSDGYVDQFGGPDRSKFMTVRFNELIERAQHLTMSKQAELLERTFEEWKGAEEQVDDVCLLGLEV